MHGPATKKPPASAFPQRMPRENTILVTVGSTRFDALVYKALSESFLACVCRALGPQAEVWIQYGHSACALPSGAKKGTLRNTEGVWIDTQGQAKTFAFAFTPKLRSWIDHAGLVISHGGTSDMLNPGSGTIIEVLRSDHAPKLLVMPNTTLMHDHQRELVQQLSQEGYLSMGHIEYVLDALTKQQYRSDDTTGALPPLCALPRTKHSGSKTSRRISLVLNECDTPPLYKTLIWLAAIDAKLWLDLTYSKVVWTQIHPRRAPRARRA